MAIAHSHKRHLRGILRWRWMLALVFASACVIYLATSIIAGGSPTVATDKPDYGAFELVTITGTGYTPGQLLDVQVVRPDLTMVTGDGSETPGYDSVNADGSGSFAYLYQLNDYAAGTYIVYVLDNATGSPLASTTFEDGKILSITLKYLNFGFGTPVDITLVEQLNKAHFAPGPNSNHGPITLSTDGTFTVEPDQVGKSVGSKIKLDIDNGTSVVRIQIHTSCSQPIGIGFLYGDDDETAEDISDFAPTGSFTAGIEITALTSADCGTLVTPTPTPISTVTSTPTNTPTATPTATPTNTPTNAYQHVDADSDSDEHADQHGDEYAYQHADADSDSDEHADEYGDEHADQHGDEYAYQHADEYAYRYAGAADEHGDEHADGYAHQHADEHGDEHAHGYGDEYGDEHADEYANQHADGYADQGMQPRG